ncbi:MAG TPA: inositol monophosphatase [Drouetiella sp.]
MQKETAPLPLMDSFSAELVFALDICEQAGRVALTGFREGIEAVEKDDGSPVTAADKECERIIREGIQSRFPDDAILGEEEGESAGRGDGKKRKWIVDPIDGTYGYARGIPFFATLLALEDNGEIVLGVVSAPGMTDMFWAEKGRGAFKNGERIEVSDINELAKSQLCFGGANRIQAEGYWSGFSKLIAGTARQRGFGDYLGFAYVFEGKAEAHVEVGVKPWDLAPMKIIVEEAGGKYTDLDGGNSIYKGSCLVSNGKIHDQWLTQLHSK